MNSYDDYDQGYGYDYGNQYDYNDLHTGDPQRDLDFDRQRYKMPDIVKKFLQYFFNTVNEGLVYELQNIYENTPVTTLLAIMTTFNFRMVDEKVAERFPKLTERFFEKSPWPDEEEVAQIVSGKDTVFMILYKELYYRHIFAKVSGGPSFDQRIASFYNYCDLFNCILGAKEPVGLELPDQWLWELVDEFVYQFQSFKQYHARLLKKADNDSELDMIKRTDVWNILSVLCVLHSLVDKSNIKRQLEVYASGGDPDSVAGEFGRHSLYKMLGYFSLVGLLRLHSLLGDYYQAIKVLENIELHKKSQYSHVPACQISTSYYVGFAYMMMRRYTDAIRTFSSILLYIQRTKQLFQSRSYQNDQINKQTEQMYHLLAICLVLHPQCIDEAIQQVLREKLYDKMCKMQSGDLLEFEACFIFACPKFLSPAPPPPSAEPSDDDYVKEAMKHQIKVFMDEVRQQKMIPTIRSYLKLYTTLPLAKLASLIGSQSGEDPEGNTQELQIHLLCFKHKMKNIVWTKGTSGLDGSFQSGSELDFYIDHDMIHIADTTVAPPYADCFIRKIHKFDELNRKLQTIKIQ